MLSGLQVYGLCNRDATAISLTRESFFRHQVGAMDTRGGKEDLVLKGLDATR